MSSLPLRVAGMDGIAPVLLVVWWLVLLLGVISGEIQTHSELSLINAPVMKLMLGIGFFGGADEELDGGLKVCVLARLGSLLSTLVNSRHPTKM